MSGGAASKSEAISKPPALTRRNCCRTASVIGHLQNVKGWKMGEGKARSVLRAACEDRRGRSARGRGKCESAPGRRARKRMFRHPCALQDYMRRQHRKRCLPKGAQPFANAAIIVTLRRHDACPRAAVALMNTNMGGAFGKHARKRMMMCGSSSDKSEPGAQQQPRQGAMYGRVAEAFQHKISAETNKPEERMGCKAAGFKTYSW